MTGVPVMIHLEGGTFKKLEQIAERKGVRMDRLIEAHIERSLQPKPAPVKITRRSTGKPAPGRKRPWVRLDLEQQVELRELIKLDWSLRELANRFGCSVGTIENWRKRFQAEGLL
jgi:hypothetical protein